jgi:tetratricopeptide (TPR) repeat protein
MYLTTLTLTPNNSDTQRYLETAL